MKAGQLPPAEVDDNLVHPSQSEVWWTTSQFAKAFKTAQAGFKAQKLRQRTQKSRWGKRKKKEKNLGRRRWRKRVAYHINYKSKRLTSDSFGFEQEIIHGD